MKLRIWRRFNTVKSTDVHTEERTYSVTVICGIRFLYLSFKSLLTWKEIDLNIRVSVLSLAVIALLASCGQEKHEPALLDSMPAGYDIYITFSPSEIDADAILCNLEETVSQAQQQMP